MNWYFASYQASSIFAIKKIDANKEVWLELIETSEYKEGLKDRYQIERKFGEAKLGHGLGCCRYLGLIGFGVQAYFTVIALNLKRIGKAQTGVGLKTRNGLIVQTWGEMSLLPENIKLEVK